MSDTITLPREVAKLALDHIEWYIENERGGRFAEVREAAEALRTALAAPRPEPTHPGYVIGSHWLETAYSRVCAGEAEAEVLKDCGWERVGDAEALRRDAERLNWVRVELFRPIWDGATDKPCEWHLRDDYKHTIQRMQGNNFRAAIDAAMEDKT